MEMHSFLSVRHVTQITWVTYPEYWSTAGVLQGAPQSNIKAVIHYISFDTNGCYKEHVTIISLIDPQPLKSQSVNFIRFSVRERFSLSQEGKMLHLQSCHDPRRHHQPASRCSHLQLLF